MSAANQEIALTETTPQVPLEHHHADVSGGWLRAAVFGAMDGLVTNIALIAGVGGGGVSPDAIILTGVSGLVAGAISMSLGEYTSVKTQNEQLDHEVSVERRELERHPEQEAEELAQRWMSRGLPPELAREVATALAENPEEALRVHAQEELGLDPHEKPSPWVAAISSFLAFGLGAFIPLVPFLFGSGTAPTVVAAIVSLLALFATGAATSIFTGRHAGRAGFRMAAIGALVAALTYLIGSAVGTAV